MLKKIALFIVLILVISSCQWEEKQKVEKKLDKSKDWVIIQPLKTKGKWIATIWNSGSIKIEEGFTN
jgi:hypothetical protein